MGTILFLAIVGGIIYLIVKKVWKRKQLAERRKEDVDFTNEYQRADLMTGEGLIVGWGWKIVDGVQRNSEGWLRYNGDLHLVTIGPTGSGKAATSQVLAIADNPGSALVLDVKGQLCAVTANWRATNWNNEVAALNPFDVLGLPTSTYNPLAHIDPKAITFASDCRRIAEGLIDVKKADHWEVSALDVVTLLIMWVVKYEDEKNLVTVRQRLNSPEDLRKKFFQDMVMCDDPALAEGAARYASDSNEVRDCIQTAVVQLGFMRDDAITRVLKGGANEIRFADLKRKGMTVYVIIPPELLNTHGKFLRLIVMSALGELIRERTQPVEPVLFMLDEFAQLGYMAPIENAANIVREYKIRLWIVLQNIPQLKGLYGEKWESFLSSAGIMQVFTANDMETAEYLSRRSGIREKVNESTSIGHSSGGSSGQGGSGSNWGTSTSVSYSTQEVPFFTPQFIMEFAPSFQLLYCSGISKAMPACRGPYWKMSWFVERNAFGPDPYHMETSERAAYEARTRSAQTLAAAMAATLPGNKETVMIGASASSNENDDFTAA